MISIALLRRAYICAAITSYLISFAFPGSLYIVRVPGSLPFGCQRCFWRRILFFLDVAWSQWRICRRHRLSRGAVLWCPVVELRGLGWRARAGVRLVLSVPLDCLAHTFRWAYWDGVVCGASTTSSAFLHAVSVSSLFHSVLLIFVFSWRFITRILPPAYKAAG